MVKGATEELLVAHGVESEALFEGLDDGVGLQSRGKTMDPDQHSTALSGEAHLRPPLLCQTGPEILSRQGLHQLQRTGETRENGCFGDALAQGAWGRPHSRWGQFKSWTEGEAVELFLQGLESASEASEGEIGRESLVEVEQPPPVKISEPRGEVLIRKRRGLVRRLTGGSDLLQKRLRVIETRQSFDDASPIVQDVVNAIAGQGPFEAPPVTVVHHDPGHGTNRLPVQHEVLPQSVTDGWIRIEGGSEETAIGTAQIFIQATQKAQREDRFSRSLSLRKGSIEIRVPEEAGGDAIAQAADPVEGLEDSLLILLGSPGLSNGKEGFHTFRTQLSQSSDGSRSLLWHFQEGARDQDVRHRHTAGGGGIQKGPEEKKGDHYEDRHSVGQAGPPFE